MVNRIDNFFNFEFDDLNQIQDAVDVENAIQKYSTYLENTVNVLNMYDEYAHLRAPNELIDKIFDMICKAWDVPNCKLGYWLCNTLRDCGGLDLLINNCVSQDQDLQFSSARLLKQCLITENCEYVLEKGVDKVMHVVCEYKKQISSVDKSNVSTGILENLFKHKKIMCSSVIQLGGLDVLLYEYRHRDIVTLEQCASALANLSLYGEPENQDHMIRHYVPTWLFTLVFNTDVDIKYYAFLAIVVLVTNKEDKVTMINPEHLNLINPSVTTHISTESNMAPHTLGQSQNWLKKLVPVLSSTREEACNLAAFYFCMDAGIKRQRGVTSIFRAINAIGPLRKVASYGNIIASKLAAKALRLIDDGVPHQLGRNVPEWSVDDVHKWATQSELNEYANNLSENLVDGDLLLQITEENLKNDIGIKNGIMIKRFMRELDNLKQSADYSSKDPTGVQSLLESIGPKYTVYTYPMLNAGVNRNSIRELTVDQIVNDCGITNSIHQSRIRYLIENHIEIHSMESSLDVFISYRRSNGSQLASLIKAYLEIQDYRVFIDVVRLENGNFGHNLLKHLKLSKNFVLVLTQNSLDRCVGDNDCNDWVHKEIVTAMQNRLNIIPIIAENFTWPELLPADMRDLRTYDAIQWSHEFQNECMDSISMAIRGDLIWPSR